MIAIGGPFPDLQWGEVILGCVAWIAVIGCMIFNRSVNPWK